MEFEQLFILTVDSDELVIPESLLSQLLFALLELLSYHLALILKLDVRVGLLHLVCLELRQPLPILLLC